MFSISEIEKILEDAEIKLSGKIAYDELDQRYYAFIEVIRDENNKQIPSNQKLLKITTEILKHETKIDFIPTDKSDQNIEGVVRATLLLNFGEHIRNSFVSSIKKQATLWIVPKRKLYDTDFEAINRKVGIIFSSAGYSLADTIATSSANLPSKYITLITIRDLSPVLIEDLMIVLQGKGLTVPSTDWMTRMLDNLRKNDSIVRRKDGAFILTLSCLRALGTQKNRRSPDVKRLLDLARRGG